MRPEPRPSRSCWPAISRALLLALACAASACGGGGEQDETSPESSADAVARRIDVQGAEFIDRAPPPSSGDPQAPRLDSDEPPVQVVDAPASVAVDVDVESVDGVEAILVRVQDADSHYRLENPPPPGVFKALLARRFVLRIPAGFPDARFCVDVAAVDRAQRVSNYRRFCFVLPRNDAQAAVLPVANAGGTQTVARNASAILDGSGSASPSGSALSYVWNQISGPPVVIQNAGSAVAGFVVPADPAGAGLGFRLTVRDAAGRSASNDTLVRVGPPVVVLDLPPQADAGPARSVAVGESITLDATASDPDGGTVSVAWTTSDPAVATISDTSTLAPTVTGVGAGQVQVQLTVTDDEGLTSSSQTTVTVTGTTGANQPPTADAGPDRQVDAGQNVILFGSASDSDGGIASVAWTQVSGAPVTLTDADTLSPSFVAPAVAEPVVLRLTVTDDGNATGSDEVSVQVVANPSPVVSIRPFAGQVPLNGFFPLQAFASDANGSIAELSWRVLRAPDRADGGIFNPAALDAVFEANEGPGLTAVLELRATDDAGAQSFATVSLRVAAPERLIFVTATGYSLRSSEDLSQNLGGLDFVMPAGFAVVSADIDPDSADIGVLARNAGTGQCQVFVEGDETVNAVGLVPLGPAVACAATSRELEFIATPPGQPDAGWAFVERGDRVLTFAPGSTPEYLARPATLADGSSADLMALAYEFSGAQRARMWVGPARLADQTTNGGTLIATDPVSLRGVSSGFPPVQTMVSAGPPSSLDISETTGITYLMTDGRLHAVDDGVAVRLGNVPSGTLAVIAAQEDPLFGDPAP